MTGNTNDIPLTDESADHCFVAGQTGFGKTTRLASWFHRVRNHHDDETVRTFFDPKGDPAAQNLDVSSINPFDVKPLDSNGHDNGDTSQ